MGAPSESGNPSVNCDNAIGQARALQTTGKYLESLAPLKTGLRLAEELKLTSKEGQIRYLLGRASLNLGNRADATTNHERAIECAKLSEDHNLLIHALLGKSITLRIDRRFDAAGKCLDAAITLAKENKEHALEARAWHSKGLILRNQSKDDEALVVLESAARMAGESNDDRMRGIILQDVAMCLGSLGLRDKALQIAKEADAISQRNEDRYQLGFGRIVLGAALAGVSRHDEALSQYESAELIANDLHAEPMKARALDGRGNALRLLGKIEDSLVCHQESLEITKKLQHKSSEALQLVAIAHLLQMSNKLPQSIAYCDKAQAIAQELQDHKLESEVLCKRAHVLLRQHQLNDALEMYEKAFGLAQEGNYSHEIAVALHGKGNALQGLGRSKEALEAFKSVEAIAVKLNDLLLLANALIGTAEAMEALKRLEEAKGTFKKAAEIGEKLKYGFAQVRAQAGLRRLEGRKPETRGTGGVNQQEPSGREATIERVIRLYGEEVLDGLDIRSEQGFRRLTSMLPDSRTWTVVLMCDIRGFTTAFARTDPEEQLEHLDKFLGRATNIIQSHGGAVDKYIGDAILAYFLPVNIEVPTYDQRAQSTLSAVRAARSLVTDPSLTRVFENFRIRYTDLAPERFGVGVGLATGYAKFGEVGARLRREYTLIGRPVNLAARVQAQATAWQVLATKECWENIVEAGLVVPFKAFDHVLAQGQVMKGYETVALVRVE